MSDMPPQDLPEPPAGPRRAAWILVIIMTMLLALAFVAVVWGFVRQARLLLAGHQVPAAAATLTLAPGARIVSARSDAGRLVLGLSTPEGEETDIIDLASGRLVQQTRTPR